MDVRLYTEACEDKGSKVSLKRSLWQKSSVKMGIYSMGNTHTEEILWEKNEGMTQVSDHKNRFKK